MYSATEMCVAITRVCGHRESVQISYKTMAQKNNLLLWGARALCKDCVANFKAWFEEPGQVRYPLELPALAGSIKQQVWAETIRSKRADHLQRVMAMAAEVADKPSVGLWQALYAYLSQPSATYWIESRNENLTPGFFLEEATYFMQAATVGVKFHPHSVYGRLKGFSPSRITQIKQMRPNAMLLAAN